jgi:hypothetical protein
MPVFPNLDLRLFQHRATQLERATAKRKGGKVGNGGTLTFQSQICSSISDLFFNLSKENLDLGHTPT